MNVKNWILLLLVYVIYLCLGGLIFRALECPNYQDNRNSEKYRKLNLASAVDHFQLTLDEEQVQEFRQIFTFVKVSENDTESSESCGKWDFFNSLFFSFTAVTTIGYGHQAPETNEGRMMCVFYSLFGVPLNAILIGALGALFSTKVSRMKKKALAAAGNLDGMGKVGTIVLEGMFWMAIFTSLFLFLPAAFFAYSGLEEKEWDYVDSVYYTFITLSTIGFGDLVAGRNIDETSEFYRILYQVAIIIWIIFGLGYIIGVLNVLAEAMQSMDKPVKRVFRGLKNHIYGQEYWKKILNEILTLKQEGGEGAEWMDGNLLTGIGGGSEPCLGDTSMTEDTVKKRSVSAGDIDLIQEDGTKLNSEFQSSLHSLDKNCLSDIQELNEDTITSLRHFLENSNIGAGAGWMGGKKEAAGRQRDRDLGEWMINNFPDEPGMSLPSLPPTRPISKSNSMRVHHTVHEVPRRNRFSSVHSQRGRVDRRHSLNSNRSIRSNSSQASIIGQLLERTTLGEFLTAVENVKVKTEAETVIVTENDLPKRKPSVFRKISQNLSRQGSRLQINQGGPLTLNQVTNLLAQTGDKTVESGLNKSTNPLMGLLSSSASMVTVKTVSQESTPEIEIRVIPSTPGTDDNIHI